MPPEEYVGCGCPGSHVSISELWVSRADGHSDVPDASRGPGWLQPPHRLLGRLFHLAALLCLRTILDLGETTLIPESRGSVWRSPLAEALCPFGISRLIRDWLARLWCEQSPHYPPLGWLSWLHCRLPSAFLPHGINRHVKMLNTSCIIASRTHTDNSLGFKGLN